MEDDGVGFVPHEHDLRVEAHGHVFYVRAVRRGQLLAPGHSSSSVDLDNPVGAVTLGVLALLAAPAVSAVQRRLRWKVGVVRIGNRGLRWYRAVHREHAPAGPVPVARLEELAGEVRAGRFLPGRSG